MDVTYCSVLGFRDEEEYDNRLDCAPDGEDDICSPADLLHCYWPSELVEHTSCGQALVTS
jgi:hypothetical protein